MKASELTVSSKGFWKGNVPAELLYITYGSLQFTTYRFANQTLRKLSENHPLPAGVESFISGACAGAVATSMTYPLDLLRTRFAAQGVDKVYNNLLDSVRQILKSEGPQGFFHGLSAGVGQIVPYMGLFFSTYETLRPPLAHMSLPFGSGDAAAGVLAGTIAKTGVFPLDLIRKRLQVQGPSRQRFANGMVPLYGRGMLNAGKAIVGKEGWRGLYRGLGIGLIKAAPASAVTMWTYERVLRQLRRHKIGEWA
ncbi:mitochondrial thiamine pyrophosphate transporter [Bachmanniomyces sp. S44760]|nr:mitochondrial thiamine pyrophosphate transporter [Bachmanniomyces sp. S44760]